MPTIQLMTGRPTPLLVQVDRPEDPDQRVDELLDQARLAQRGHARVAPAHQREQLARRRPLADAYRVARAQAVEEGSACRFTSAWAHGCVSATAHQAMAVASPTTAAPNQSRPSRGLQPGGRIAGDDAGDGHADVAGELVQTNDQPTLVGP